MDQRVKWSDYKFFLFSSLSRLSGICTIRHTSFVKVETPPLYLWYQFLKNTYYILTHRKWKTKDSYKMTGVC